MVRLLSNMLLSNLNYCSVNWIRILPRQVTTGWVSINIMEFHIQRKQSLLKKEKKKIPIKMLVFKGAFIGFPKKLSEYQLKGIGMQVASMNRCFRL